MAAEFDFLTRAEDELLEERRSVHLTITGYAVGGKSGDKGVAEKKLLLRSLQDLNEGNDKIENCLRKLHQLTTSDDVDAATKEMVRKALADGKSGISVHRKMIKYLNVCFDKTPEHALAWSTKDTHLTLTDKERKEMKEIDKEMKERQRSERGSDESPYRKRGRYESDGFNNRRYSGYGSGPGSSGGGYSGYSAGPNYNAYSTGPQVPIYHSGVKNSAFRGQRPRFPSSVNGCNNCYEFGHWERTCTKPRAPDSAFPFHQA